jgi:flagella basal body P-ring formation protein FlgA
MAGGPSVVVGGASAVAIAATASEKTGVTRQPTPRAACTGWLWADVRVMGPTPVARRAIRAGEPVSPGAVRLEDREIRAGQAPAVIGADVVADRLIAAGQVIEPSAVRAAGPRNGEALKVVLVSGGLQIEQLGHALACGRAQCAVLPSGKHVEGTLVEGRLMVTVQ